MVFRREPPQCGEQIGLYVRVGVLLNGQGRRGVARISEQGAVATATCGKELHDVTRDLDEPLPRRVNGQLRRGDEIGRKSFDLR